MTRDRCIAAAQSVASPGDVPANIAQHLRLCALAATRGVRVLVFPELSLTGYELDLADRLAFTETDPRLVPLAEAARTHAITLIAGAPIRLGERLHLGAFIFSPDEAIAVYTKRYLGAFSSTDSPDGIVPPPEPSVFSPGDRSPLVEDRGHLAAIAICAEIWRPAHVAGAVERGAKAYLASTFTIVPDLAPSHANLSACAQRHAMPVVFSNYGGPSGGLASGGRSAIWSEHGALLTQLEPGGLGLALASEHASGWRAEAIMLGAA